MTSATVISATTTLIALMGCDAAFAQRDCVEADSALVKDTRKIAPFHSVEVRGSADVRLRQGKHRDIVVRTRANVQKLLETRVEDGTLIVEIDGCVRNASTIEVSVWVPEPRQLSVSGSGSIDASGLKVKSLSVSVSGSGDVDLSGKATSLAANVSGSGDVRAKSLATRSASVSVSGSGDAVVRASHALDASVAGSGKIRYAGSPQVQRSIAGSGSIERL